VHVDKITPATGGDVATFDVPAVSVPLSRGAVDPRVEGGGVVPHYLIPVGLAARYGMQAAPTASQALFRAPHSLTDRDIDRVRRAIGTIPGAYAQSANDLREDHTSLRLLITGAAIVLALVIVAIAVALVASESRRERAILSAVGAAPSFRRRLAAGNAFLLTGIAAWLAVPAGFVPAALIEISKRAGYPIIIPWQVIGLVAIVTPAVASLFAALASREPKSNMLLQPVW
jgi:putative ABC transport system permease protein